MYNIGKRMKRIKKLYFFTLPVIINLCLFSASALAAEKKIAPIAVVAHGSRTDQSWAQSIYEAYLSATMKYPNIKITFSDMTPFSEAPNIFDSLGEAGIGLIYTPDAFYEIIGKIAPKHPNTNFFMPCVPAKEIKALGSPNIFSYGTRDEESGYLAGVAAGKLTKTNKLGFISGGAYPLIVREGKAFEMGAKSINPKVELLVVYTGDWVDAQKGYEAAKAMINLGADVIMQYNDNAGKGIIKAAQDAGIWVIGEAMDQYDLSPKYMVTSFIINHTRVMEEAIRDYIAGKLTQDGKWFGLREGEAGIAPIRDNVPNEVNMAVNKIKAKIISGDLIVPVVTDPEELKPTK